MKRLYCFDVDGTLLTDENCNDEYLKGIIESNVLLQLEKEGNVVVIVSPSPYLDKEFRDERHWIKEYVNNDDRWLNVKKAMSLYGFDEKSTIYIDDNIELCGKVENALGVLCIQPEDFINWLKNPNDDPESSSLTGHIQKNCLACDILLPADYEEFFLHDECYYKERRRIVSNCNCIHKKGRLIKTCNSCKEYFKTHCKKCQKSLTDDVGKKEFCTECYDTSIYAHI
ncbi:MAG: hypothetical protein K5793_03745 [Nitrosarchaeum sp.]|nr:hypothetical protein [Nitrosarchaeum sp.]